MGALNSEATKNQCSMILRYLQDYGSISQLEAANELGCYRLSSRIYDLKQQGYNIVKTMESKKNRYGKSVSFARYAIKEETA